MGIIDTLGLNINKAKGSDTDTTEGVISDFLPELDLDMDDEDLIKLTKQWEKEWDDSEVQARWKESAEDNENYWLGKQYGKELSSGRPMVDNIIFESLETFLTQATRRNPEPHVTLKSTYTSDEEVPQDFIDYSEKVEGKLKDATDEQSLRLVMKQLARNAEISLVGVSQSGWDADKNMPVEVSLRPKQCIFDPNGTVNPLGIYTGRFFGVFKKKTAEELKTFAKDQEAKDKIDEVSKDKDATLIQYREFWTDEYTCWKLDDVIILKKRNPHWNYDETTTEETVNEYGGAEEVEKNINGINHLPKPSMPFHFLVEFNLEKSPISETSLISQNLSNQDIINKRNKQIDKNVSSMNNGWIVSLARAGLSKEQAAQVVKTMNEGGIAAIPDGAPREAVDRIVASAIPTDVYNDTLDKRRRVRDIFGITGITPAGQQNESTVRGKIINKSLDSDRIGGGISEYIEQCADNIVNYWLQLMYVYDDDFGQVSQPPQLLVGIKEGSMLPRDNTTIANQAIELANAGKMSTVDLYERLEYPNAQRLAANAWLEVNAPEVLFKDVQEVAQVMQQRSQQAQQEAQATMQAELAKEQVTETLKHRNTLEENTQKTRLNIIEKQADEKIEEGLAPE